MRRKLKDTGGLTMVEMLCAVAILVLLCLMMNTCLTMATRTYQAVTAESEAQLLVSSLSDALADKLRYALITEKKDAAGNVIARSIFITEYSVLDAGDEVTVKTVGVEDQKVTVDSKQLLPAGAYGATGQFSSGYIGRYTVEKAKADDGSELPLVTYVSGTNSFTVKFTVKDEQLETEREAEFTVRCLNPVKKEEVE